MRVFALALLCVAVPAFAADQFDLACQGTRVGKRDAPSAPYSVRLRLDLTAKQYCADACERITAIDDVQSDRIVIKDDTMLNTREESTTEIIVDRKANRYHRLYIQVRPETIYEKIETSCTVQPFTPFPKGS